MVKMTAEQRKTIYGMAIQLGIYEKGNPHDDLHGIVSRITRKESLGQLTNPEAALIIQELINYKDGLRLPRKPTKKEVPTIERPGMILPDQVKKIWFFMYRLQEFDREPSKVTLGYRLCKIIEKNLPISAIEQDPFRFITFEQASTLIEILKKMVQYEKRKAKKV